MSKCNVIDSIGKLRSLREKLCDQEKSWINEALDERTKVVSDLLILHKMFLAEDYDIVECKEKLEEILCCLNVDVALHDDSNS